MSEHLSVVRICDEGQMTPLLLSHCMSEKQASKKAEMFKSCAKALSKHVDKGTEAAACFVPGRIEVLGKHTDYAGGRSIITAVEKGFCFVAAYRSDAKIRAIDLAGSQDCVFEISAAIEPRLGHWSNYPQTLARRLAKNFGHSLCGADIVFLSDLPIASGMSSSSAMIVGFFLILSAINDLPQRPEYKSNIKSNEDLASYLGTVENGQNFGTLEGDKGVGTFGGSEDHTAMLCCRPGKLSQYSYCPVRLHRLIDMPPGYIFCVASSGVVAEKTGAAMEKYNRASRLAVRIVEIWNEKTGRSDKHIAEALASSEDALSEMRTVLAEARDPEFSPKDLAIRFMQFHSEHERIIPNAGDELVHHFIEEFGKTVDTSQDYAERLLGNQVHETIHLARTARKLGAAAASAFGAGFGGSVWAMVKTKKADSFLQKWAHDYTKNFPKAAAHAEFITTQAGPAAFIL